MDDIDMELIWNEFGVQRLVMRRTAQVELEGTVPLPENIGAVSELIDYSASVTADACRTDEGRVLVSGRIELQAAALTPDEKPFAFTSESEFSSETEAEEVCPGMNADALPLLKSLTLRAVGGSQLRLNAVIDIELTVTTAAPTRTLAGISGLTDLETKKEELRTARRVELANETVRIGEEISGGAEEVLKYSVQLSMRDTGMENGSASVSGILQLNALCRSAEGELMQLVRSIPFRESIALSGSADEIYTVAEIRNVEVRSLGTEFSLVAVDADVNFRVFGMRRGSISLPVDAFSPTLDFDCITERIEVLNAEGGACGQYSVRDNISVPEGYPDIFTALHASANPIVTSVNFDDGTMRAEGLLVTRLVYRSSDNTLHAFTEEVAFGFNMAAPVGTGFARLRVYAQPSITGGGGRTAQISFAIDACAEFLSETGINAVTGIVENGRPKKDSAFSGGIVIYNACEGETFFDIAKRFRVEAGSVKALNPDAREPACSGDRLIVIA